MIGNDYGVDWSKSQTKNRNTTGGHAEATLSIRLQLLFTEFRHIRARCLLV